MPVPTIFPLCAGLMVATLLALAAPAEAQKAPETPQSCGLGPAEVFRRAEAGVVQIMSFGLNPYQIVNRVEAKSGSGVFLGDDLVATNFHVVMDASAIAVMAGETVLEAELVGRDPTLDIAVLRAPGLFEVASPVELAPQDGLMVGQPAHVIGFPLGVGKSLSTGIVSGLERKLPLNTSSWLSPFIQTDAAVSAGNSGGLLADDCARMIGIVTLRSPSPEAENIGYAIPAETLRHELPELIETGKVARPWHGLYGQMVNPVILQLLGAPPEAIFFARGFLVETVEPGSAADKAGIRGGTLPVLWGMREMILGGDIILQVNGHPILSLEDARTIVRGLEIGQTVTVTLLREGESIEVTAMMEERPTLERDLEVFRLP